MDPDFSNSTTVVLGASSGIGYQVAEDIGARGGRTILVSRTRARPDPISSTHIEGDICDLDSVPSLVSEISSVSAAIDYVVVTAGVFKVTPLQAVTVPEWLEVMNTNVSGPFFLIRDLLPLLENGQGKSIVLLGSVLARASVPGLTAYSLSKAGTVALARCLSVEMASRAIRVNSVSPSYIDTPMIRPFVTDESAEHRISSFHPLGRIGTAKDVSELILFLLHDASWLTGQDIVIDGGRLACISVGLLEK